MLHHDGVSQWYVQYKLLSFDNLLLLKGNKNPHNTRQECSWEIFQGVQLEILGLNYD